MLYIVGTPIGHLADMTFRAVETLRNVELIAAEDTRRTAILLKHYGIVSPLLSYHEHNEARRTAELVQKLQNGMRLALVTDAGMPAISDPGNRLIRACIENEVPMEVIPGVSAVTTAIAGSGLGGENFYFGGFLPNKSGQRHKALERALESGVVSLFFESPHRLLKTLRALEEAAPSQPLCVARELTKKFQEFQRGNASELIAHYSARPPKGEVTLLIAGSARTRNEKPITSGGDTDRIA